MEPTDLNLKALNKFVKCQGFKMEGPQLIKAKEDWMVTVDLKMHIYVYLSQQLNGIY